MASRPSLLRVFALFLRLGLTSFGGPVAHLGYFREAFVVRRGWLDERQFADLVALCQFLPGPASSQVGIALGASQRGPAGGVAAWLGFTLPSAVVMLLVAGGYGVLGDALPAGLLQGLKIVAVAVVAQAVRGMAQRLTPDRPRATLALLAAMGVVVWPGPGAQVAMIVLGGVAGRLLLPGSDEAVPASSAWAGIGRRRAAVLLGLFALLLAGLPVAAAALPAPALSLVDRFYRTGSLVFGGGHVVLPLLQAEVMAPGWVGRDAFLVGYGAAQALPGPLFTFSAYLGALIGRDVAGAGPTGALLFGGLGLGAIFLPSFLLLYGVLPFWEALRQRAGVRDAMRGVNAAVVGLLLAALYDPVWSAGIRAPAHFALGVGAFALLALWRVPPWLVVVLTALAGAAVL